MVMLVTGVAGFIGTNFMHYYLNKYPDSEILGVDKLTYAGNYDNIKSLESHNFKFVRGDISDENFIDSLFKNYNIESVINFAAESHVDRSIDDSSVFIKSNIYGVFNLINCSKNNLFIKNKWKEDFKFLQISTDEVYGSIKNGKFSETSPIQPNNPYSASKASADLLIQSYHNTYKFPGLISRCSNNYGPYQHPEKFIPTVITHALNHREIPIYGTGKQIRDWIHVMDHCSAIDCIFKNGRIGEIYNIGGNHELTNIDLTLLILENLKRICKDVKISPDLIKYIKDRPGHDKRYAMDATKLRSQLGWKPSIRFRDGLKKTIEWYIDRLS